MESATVDVSQLSHPISDRLANSPKLVPCLPNMWEKRDSDWVLQQCHHLPQWPIISWQIKSHCKWKKDWRGTDPWLLTDVIYPLSLQWSYSIAVPCHIKYLIFTLCKYLNSVTQWLSSLVKITLLLILIAKCVREGEMRITVCLSDSVTESPRTTEDMHGLTL